MHVLARGCARKQAHFELLVVEMKIFRREDGTRVANIGGLGAPPMVQGPNHTPCGFGGQIGGFGGLRPPKF